MSAVSAEVWSVSTLAKMRIYEQQCPDDELFYIGYLIPLVERVELDSGEESEEPQAWNQRYIEYLEQCIGEDSLSTEDCKSLRLLCQKVL